MNKHIGSNFGDFLKEEGVFDDVEAVALKRSITSQIQDVLEKRNSGNTSPIKPKE